MECRARRPKLSPLCQCLDAHFDTFPDIYSEAYEHDYGFLRPIIPEVFGRFMGCGGGTNAFASVHCDHCACVSCSNADSSNCLSSFKLRANVLEGRKRFPISRTENQRVEERRLLAGDR